jgi:hypothetical protein
MDLRINEKISQGKTKDLLISRAFFMELGGGNSAIIMFTYFVEMDMNLIS